MARQHKRDVFLAQNLAKRINIPAPFLAKTLHILAKEEILNSTKGRKGGCSLARPAPKIKLIEIVEAIDGLGLVGDCVLGIPHCSDEHPCEAHAKWTAVRVAIMDLLSNTTPDGAAQEPTT